MPPLTKLVFCTVSPLPLCYMMCTTLYDKSIISQYSWGGKEKSNKKGESHRSHQMISDTKLNSPGGRMHTDYMHGHSDRGAVVSHCNS